MESQSRSIPDVLMDSGSRRKGKASTFWTTVPSMPSNGKVNRLISRLLESQTVMVSADCGVRLLFLAGDNSTKGRT